MNARLRDLVLSSLGALVLGFAAAGALMLLLGKNPFAAYALLASSVVRDGYTFADIFVKATPLVFTALAFALAYKANLFNIGAQGQFYLGAVASAAVCLGLGGRLPGPLVLVIALAASCAAGGLWGALVGAAKARFGANEFLTSMMSTYVALAAMNYLLRTALLEKKGEYPQTDAFDASVWLPVVFKGTRLHLGFFLALAAAAGVWVLLYRTGLGFRIRVAGDNPDAARLAGMDAGRIYALVFLLAGALAGCAGFAETAGVQHMLVQGFNPGLGAEGIGIAILANANPLGIVFASVLFGALKVGGQIMGQLSGIPSSIVELMEGFVMVFVILSHFVRARVLSAREKRALQKREAL